MEFNHVSVLMEETIESLNIKPDGIYVDGTLGGAGHASRVCEKLSQKGTFIGIDQDEDALSVATDRLSKYKDKINLHIVKSNYSNFENVLNELGIDKVDGILLDIGVSSYQIDTADRGFTYKEENAPLDMRMDKSSSFSAKNVVNEYSEMELFRVIRDYGEDKFAKNIAKHIVAARQEKEIETTGELIEIIKAAIPMKIRAKMGHPAKQTFQAIRIEVNKELEVLEKSIDAMIDRLNPNGRLSIITFHSLEDRIVKNKFKANEDPCVCPKNFPKCVCGNVSKGKSVFRKPVIPSDKEIEENKRSKSSKLRTFERSGE